MLGTDDAEGAMTEVAAAELDAADAAGPSVAVALAVAAREGVDPVDLPPLHEVVDTDALDALFGGDGGVDGTLTFAYHGHEVTLDGDGTVAVRE